MLLYDQQLLNYLWAVNSEMETNHDTVERLTVDENILDQYLTILADTNSECRKFWVGSFSVLAHDIKIRVNKSIVISVFEGRVFKDVCAYNYNNITI